jgi:hypothetical protein
MAPKPKRRKIQVHQRGLRKTPKSEENEENFEEGVFDMSV